jgi:hypothetical protein
VHLLGFVAQHKSQALTGADRVGHGAAKCRVDNSLISVVVANLF